MNVKKQLGQRIKEIRKSKKITQEHLAEIINVEPTTISNIECGRNYPTMGNLESILNVLESNFQEVFDFQHFDEKSELINKLKKYIDSADDKEIEFLYKTVVNLSQFKN